MPKKIVAIAPQIKPYTKSVDVLLSLIVIITYVIADIIGIPLIAPATFGPAKLAIIKMIATITADARLFKRMSILFC